MRRDINVAVVNMEAREGDCFRVLPFLAYTIYCLITNGICRIHGDGHLRFNTLDEISRKRLISSKYK